MKPVRAISVRRRRWPGRRAMWRRRAQRIQVMQADADRLKTMQKYETITAPFEGVVTKRYANTGAMIQAGTASQSQAMPVVRLSQNNLLRLILPVPESSVAQVAIGARNCERARTRSEPDLSADVSLRFTDKVQLSTCTRWIRKWTYRIRR